MKILVYASVLMSIGCVSLHANCILDEHVAEQLAKDKDGFSTKTRKFKCPVSNKIVADEKQNQFSAQDTCKYCGCARSMHDANEK